MNQTFWSILLIGILFVALQGFLASRDGYFNQAQMSRHGVRNGWSFLEHGGMWADVFVISPLVAYLCANYQLPLLRTTGLIICAASIIVTAGALVMYANAGNKTPEAHAHHGKTTLAGWLHAVFAAVGIWVSGVFYLCPTQPQPSTLAVALVTAIFIPFFFLGVWKFSPKWKLDRGPLIQCLCLSALVIGLGLHKTGYLF